MNERVEKKEKEKEKRKKKEKWKEKTKKTFEQNLIVKKRFKK